MFIMLQPPFHALRTSTIANIMEEAICTAALEDNEYSAKSFRAICAAAAIDSGQNPDIVMKTGRWKTASVFGNHYVLSLPPTDHIHTILYHERQFEQYRNSLYRESLKFILTMCSVTQVSKN